MSKIVGFFALSREVGIRLAIRYSLGWMKFHISREKPDTSRLEFKRVWIKSLKKRHNLIGAEIGVRRGKHAAFLIDNLDIQKLYLIDPYEAYDEFPGVWANDDAMAEVETTARERLGGFRSTTFIRKYSTDAVSDLSEDLDFLYIDVNHKYEFVKADIANYYPLLKEGGILAGHDYVDAWPGVIRAVHEFSQMHGLKVQKAMFGDWFINKKTNES
jgi:hypothetical protein